jgi:hypothetical protein
MSTKAFDTYQRKVDAIFRELAGLERARWLEPGVPSRCFDQIARAVRSKSGYSKKVARHIGFNVADWQAEAAFLVALHLFPERFTDAEIDAAVISMLVHVPAHVIAAAKLAGHSTEDIFAELEGRAEPAAAPNGGPAEPLGNSGVREGPPSVS